MNKRYEVRSPFFAPLDCETPDVAVLLALCFDMSEITDRSTGQSHLFIDGLYIESI